jgi:hypothetical protein
MAYQGESLWGSDFIKKSLSVSSTSSSSFNFVYPYPESDPEKEPSIKKNKLHLFDPKELVND